MKIIQKYTVLLLIIINTMQTCAMDNEHPISNVQSIVAQQGREQQEPTKTDEQGQARWKGNEKVTSLFSYGCESADHAELIGKQCDAIVQAVKDSDYEQFKKSCLLLDACTPLFISPKAPKSLDFIRNYKTGENFYDSKTNFWYANSNLLHIAASKLNNNKIVKFLLQAGVDANTQDDAQQVALHYASTVDNLDSVELLLDYGAKTDYISKGTLDTPLTEACRSQSARVANVLITRGANLEHCNSMNLSALRFTIWCVDKKFVDTAKLLIKYGADINAKDEHGRTLLHTAIYYGRKDMLKLLLDAGANVDIQDDQGKKPEEIRDDIEIQDLIAQARIDRAASSAHA